MVSIFIINNLNEQLECFKEQLIVSLKLEEDFKHLIEKQKAKTNNCVYMIEKLNQELNKIEVTYEQ